MEPASPAPAPEPTPGSSAGPGDGAASAVAEPPTPQTGRQERSPRDMALSLAVLIVPIALLLIFYRFVLNGDAPATVDPSDTIQEARQAAGFTVAVPAGLDRDWQPTSATFTRQGGGATLRIGYLGPGRDPVQLVESSVPAATLLPDELGRNARPVQVFRAANGVWRRYDGRPGEQALVLSDGDRTIVVVGNTDAANLERLASALH